MAHRSLRARTVALLAAVCAAAAADADGPVIYRPKQSWANFDSIKRPILDPIFKALISENAPLEVYMRSMRNAPPPKEVAAWLDDTLKKPVVIFTYAFSPFCTEALKVLKSTGCRFATVELGKTWFMVGTKGQAIRAELVRRTRQSSMPHIFIGGQWVGGLFTGGEEYPWTGEGLMKLVEDGVLMQMLRDSGAACYDLPPPPPPPPPRAHKNLANAILSSVKEQSEKAKEKASRGEAGLPVAAAEVPKVPSTKSPPPAAAKPSTPSEIAKIDADEVFGKSDQDKSGKLGPDELADAILGLGFGATPEQLEKLIAEYDQSSDGQLDLTEFHAVVENMKRTAEARAQKKAPAAENKPPAAQGTAPHVDSGQSAMDFMISASASPPKKAATTASPPKAAKPLELNDLMQMTKPPPKQTAEQRVEKMLEQVDQAVAAEAAAREMLREELEDELSSADLQAPGVEQTELGQPEFLETFNTFNVADGVTARHQVEVSADVPARLAQIVRTEAAIAISHRGHFTIAIAGGSLVKMLGAMAGMDGVQWDKWHVAWVDERCVAHDNPESNYGGAKAAWLDKVPIPKSQIYAIDDQIVQLNSGSVLAEAAAKDYEHKLRSIPVDVLPRAPEDFWPDGEVVQTAPEGAFPQFDLLLLGFGPDGHICSLFPGHELLNNGDERWILPISDSPKPPPERITFSMGAVNGAKKVVLVGTGDGKKGVVGSAFTMGTELPCTMIEGTPLWLIDAPAAAELPAEVCATRSRRRQLGADPPCLGGACSNEQAWWEEWGQRMDCWWVETPWRTAMQACVGALGVHLAERFELFMRLRGGGQALGQPAQQAEQGCEWVSEGERLQLPDFPSLGENGFDFSLPPIPRLLPSWQHLQTLAPAADYEHDWFAGLWDDAGADAADAAVQTDPSYASSIGAGAGAGVLIGALFAVGFNTYRSRRGGAVARLALRRAAGAAGQTPATAKTAEGVGAGETSACGKTPTSTSQLQCSA